MNIVTTNRQLLQAGVSPVAFIADAVTGWARLCRDYRASSLEERRLRVLMSASHELAEQRCRGLRPRPVKPDPDPIDTSLPLDTIVAQTNSPEWKATWAAYERDLSAWEGERSSIEEEVTGAAVSRWETAQAYETDLFIRIRHYPVTTLAQLDEKASFFEERYGEELEASEALALMADIKRLAEVRP